jgi:hypothetical protein
MATKKMPISLKEIFQEIMDFPNHKSDKGYTGSYHIDIPNKTLFHLRLDNVIILCKLIVNIYGNKNQWGDLPGGKTKERVIETSDKFYKQLCKELKKQTGQTTETSLLKNIFVEMERFGLIERDMETHRFRITKLGKEFGKFKIESDCFSFQSNNMMQKLIQNRFENDSIWYQYITHTDTIVQQFGTIYWFDLWILAFSVGDNAKYELDYVIEVLADIRKWCGLTRGYDDSKLVSFNRDLIEEFTNVRSENKYDKIDIKQLSILYNRMAELLDLSGRFTLIGDGQDFFLRHKDNRNLPKTIRNNSTDRTFYIESKEQELRNTIGIDNHHIIPHAKAKIYNGLNKLINDKKNKLSIARTDHKKIPTQEIDNVYLKLVVKDKCVFLVNPKKESDYIELEHTEHFNFKELSKAVDFNRIALKKLKTK